MTHMCSLHSVTRVWATRWAACSDEAKKGLAPPKMWRAHNAGRPRGCARQSLHKKQEGRRRRVDTSDPDRPAYERAHNGAGVSGARLPSTPFPQPLTLPNPPATSHAELPTHPSTHLACSAGAARHEGGTGMWRGCCRYRYRYNRYRYR